MKILYAIQGTGNGHLSRARDVIPALALKGDLDIVVSGTQADISLSYPVKYSCKGLGFIFGKNGGVDLLSTFLKNRTRRFIKEVKMIPVEKYDLLINDFEPVTAWAAKMKNIPCIALSHQCAVLSENAPKPEHTDPLGSFILKNYAPCTAKYGFHFAAFGENIFTPIIRKEVREMKVSNRGHYTVYLPSYDDANLQKKLKSFKKIKWQVFSKHCKSTHKEGNITFMPINNELFIQSMASCEGMLCGAGFETPAEALFLRKKLMVIPMKNQYEQHCNAASLKALGIPVIKVLKKKNFDAISDWIESVQQVEVNYEDETEKIIGMIVDRHSS